MGTIVHIVPESVEDELVLNVSYGHITEGKTLDDLIAEYNVVQTLKAFGPDRLPIEFNICKSTCIGPVFIGDEVIFGPLFISGDEWEPLHCDECARIVMRWFTYMQIEWRVRYHAEWSSYSAGERTRPQRVN